MQFKLIHASNNHRNYTDDTMLLMVCSNDGQLFFIGGARPHTPIGGCTPKPPPEAGHWMRKSLAQQHQVCPKLPAGLKPDIQITRDLLSPKLPVHGPYKSNQGFEMHRYSKLLNYMKIGGVVFEKLRFGGLCISEIWRTERNKVRSELAFWVNYFTPQRSNNQSLKHLWRPYWWRKVAWR